MNKIFLNILPGLLVPWVISFTVFRRRSYIIKKEMPLSNTITVVTKSISRNSGKFCRPAVPLKDDDDF